MSTNELIKSLHCAMRCVLGVVGVYYNSIEIPGAGKMLFVEILQSGGDKIILS